MLLAAAISHSAFVLRGGCCAMVEEPLFERAGAFGSQPCFGSGAVDPHGVVRILSFGVMVPVES